MKGEALFGLVKAERHRSSREWHTVDRDKRFSMKELSILVQLPNIPKEHVSYFCGRLEATIRDAEKAGMQTRKQLASDLLEGMQKLAMLYAGTYQPEVQDVTDPTPAADAAIQTASVFGVSELPEPTPEQVEALEEIGISQEVTA